MSVRWAIAGLLWLATSLPGWAGELVAHSLASAALGRSWTYSVYLPDGYAGGTMRYPVLFFLPGHSVTRGDWSNLSLQRLADAAIAAGRMPPALIVVPEMGTTWGVDRKERMETALMHDLLPEVERQFRVLPGREGRAIGGISAGGFAALRFALKYPDQFAAAALLSPAIYDPEPPPQSGSRRAGVFGEIDFDPAVWRALNYPALLPGFLASGRTMPLHIAAGDADRLGIEWQAAKLHHIWREHGMPSELRIIAGGPTYAVWRDLFTGALSFVFHYTAAPAH